MSFTQFTIRVWLVFAGCLLVASSLGADEGTEFFEAKIRPVLSDECYSCHSQQAAAKDKLEGGLRLDQREAALRGGDSGAVIVPGKPEASLLLSALRHDDLKMPPKGPLEKTIVDNFDRWIRMGAPWPEDANPAATPDRRTDYDYWRANHWAWKPLKRTPPASSAHDTWSQSRLDQYVFAELAAAGLSPSPQADRETLIRRVYFDLLGLPPSYNTIQAFVGDPRPDAYVHLVDRLLASPAVGEKWGRHWLDVARYADNGGFNSQTPELYTDFPYAYTYRDYVIAAFNQDLPYDQFILQQLAADQMELGSDNRPLAALGFLTLGDKSFGTTRADRIDDCIDTVTRGILATTVSCARCHNHKYDPIPTEDYYSLFNVFENSNIDVAARLHTKEKSAALPLLFATEQARAAYEHHRQEAQSALQTAEQHWFAKVQRHLLQRSGDYLLAAAGRASADKARSEGLAKEVTKRWQAYLKKAAKDPFFAAWQAFEQLGKDASADNFAAQLRSLQANTGDSAPQGDAGILAALTARPPHNLAEVATIYGEVIQAAGSEAASAPSKATEEEPNEMEQGVRKLLHDKESPLRWELQAALRLPVHAGADQLAKLRSDLNQATYDHPRAVAASDSNKPSQGHVYLRGNPSKRGPPVSRQFLALLESDRKAFQRGSGRLELAQAMLRPDNPLTSRVIVNRIWHHYFGRGLVEDCSDFGSRSDPPTHPELLDDLALRLVDRQWSLKWLHREILLSATYRQTSWDREPVLRQKDPDNRLLWRANRRRLSLEALRDALLASAGELDRSIGGQPVDTWSSRRRTIYGYVDRYQIAAAYMTFDFPSTNRTSPKRDRTLIPQQALFLMNAPFVKQQAERLVAQPAFLQAGDDAQRVRWIYQQVLGRLPDDDEAQAARQFVRESGESSKSAGGGNGNSTVDWSRLSHALFLSNEFMYVD